LSPAPSILATNSTIHEQMLIILQLESTPHQRLK